MDDDPSAREWRIGQPRRFLSSDERPVTVRILPVPLAPAEVG